MKWKRTAPEAESLVHGFCGWRGLARANSGHDHVEPVFGSCGPQPRWPSNRIVFHLFFCHPLTPFVSHFDNEEEHLNTFLHIAEVNCLDSVDCSHMMNELGDTVHLKTLNFIANSVHLLLLTSGFRQG